MMLLGSWSKFGTSQRSWDVLWGTDSQDMVIDNVCPASLCEAGFIFCNIQKESGNEDFIKGFVCFPPFSEINMRDVILVFSYSLARVKGKWLGYFQSTFSDF